MDVINWLFGTREGSLALIGGGILLCLLIAFVLERRTRKVYTEHPADPDDEDADEDE
ncbi:MAG: hypothetical protein PHR15_04650 [Atopobiaceae bacterium]|jgi:uncharacterized membrane protein|nr:hypothetical protein [Atopobiaceae bacterium]MCH4181420.1 hypothetical protein [Atopobiaceae bacterium]MCH4214999.1 hypothetical protein [Atopobiaceae bacterium]MCH4230022.1 hypothetical protein [Atopobiaceae bacterium]MCH4277174.1 hypothetical protein [Atopobiaceae bacterium]